MLVLGERLHVLRVARGWRGRRRRCAGGWSSRGRRASPGNPVTSETSRTVSAGVAELLAPCRRWRGSRRPAGRESAGELADAGLVGDADESALNLGHGPSIVAHRTLCTAIMRGVPYHSNFDSRRRDRSRGRGRPPCAPSKPPASRSNGSALELNSKILAGNPARTSRSYCASIRSTRTRVGLKGPVTTPIAGGFQSVNVALRKQLDLFANVRPVRMLARPEDALQRRAHRHGHLPREHRGPLRRARARGGQGRRHQPEGDHPRGLAPHRRATPSTTPGAPGARR